MVCGLCGREIEAKSVCYQILEGEMIDGVFVSDLVYAYHCVDCGVETGDFVNL